MIGRIVTVAIIGILALGLIGCGAQSRQKSVSPDDGATTPREGDAPFGQSGDFSNFRLLVSDEVNAIGDFESLNVVISRIGVHGGGESGGWTEITLQATDGVTGSGPVSLDLTMLQGDRAQEIWSGHMEPGSYSKMFIYVDEVTGVLEDTGEVITVKLPSNKLHLSVPFEVTESSVTSFVYDITVIAAGNSKAGRVKYILKPQILESGSEVRFEEVEPEEELGEDPAPETEPAEDTTAPTLEITGVEDGVEYTGPVIPTFSASDDQDAPEALTLSAKLDGEAFVSGSEVSAAGDHTLEVKAKDSSGNEVEMAIEFEIPEP